MQAFQEEREIVDLSPIGCRYKVELNETVSVVDVVGRVVGRVGQDKVGTPTKNQLF